MTWDKTIRGIWQLNSMERKCLKIQYSHLTCSTMEDICKSLFTFFRWIETFFPNLHATLYRKSCPLTEIFVKLMLQRRFVKYKLWKILLTLSGTDIMCPRSLNYIIDWKWYIVKVGKSQYCIFFLVLNVSKLRIEKFAWFCPKGLKCVRWKIKSLDNSS